MDASEKTSARNIRAARDVVRDLGVVAAWESVGAKVNLVGSLKTGLLVKHLDIDFHIYTPELRVEDSFRALAALAANPRVGRVEYTNLADTQEACIEWHAWYTAADRRTWQIDMIHILKGSTYDGFFETVADRIAAALTPETKKAILQLKFDTPEDEKIMGIEYYVAVLRDGVRDFKTFTAWRRDNPVEGILLWTP